MKFVVQATCRVCTQPKPPGYCKPCRRKYQRQYRQTRYKADRLYAENIKRIVQKSDAKARLERPEIFSRRRKSADLRKRYGIGIAEQQALREAQLNCCKICHCQLNDLKASMQQANVDHDHSTGRVRGILCRGCNIGLGAFCDDPATLRAAANYLEEQKWPINQLAPQL